MSEKKPMVTILLATCEGERYLPQLLESIRTQKYENWRLLVRDDNSQDSTMDILRMFAAKVPQNVKITVNEPASGSARNNFALLFEDAAYEKADYVMCCDQDDVWKPEKIFVTMQTMLWEEHVLMGSRVPILVHTDLEVVDEQGDVIAPSMSEMSQIRRKQTLEQLLLQNHVTGCTMMINGPLLLGVADYIHGSAVIMHDYWCALYATVFGKVVAVKRATVEYRQHGKNSVGAKDSRRLSYLLGRLGQGKADYKNQMHDSRKQVRWFLKCYGVRMKETRYEKEYELMREYGELGRQSRAVRHTFYREHHAWKKGLVRKIMQYFWG